jgi:group I intron endonuclease
MINLNNLPEQSGIYEIHNEWNGKTYVGQSVNIRQRIKTHFSQLKNNSHENKAMQEDYNNDQAEWEINILELTNSLKTRELYWLYFFEDFLYNSIPKPMNWMQKIHHSKAKKLLEEYKKSV